MPKCSFCKKQYEIPRGLTIVMNDNSVKYFCSSKCRKNSLKLKRDKNRVRWTNYFRDSKLEKNKIDKTKKAA